MTSNQIGSYIRRLLVKLGYLLTRIFGYDGHDWLTSASDPTGDNIYYWLVMKEETTLTYTDTSDNTEYTKTLPAFFEIGGNLKDISVASGEVLAYRKTC